MSKKADNYRKGLRDFINASEKRKIRQRNDILEKMKKAVPDFLDCFESVEKVAVIGSVAKKRFYSLHSDVDILIKGLKKEDYFKAFRFWEDNLNTQIDLVREEEVTEKIRSILKDEVIIYEKS